MAERFALPDRYVIYHSPEWEKLVFCPNDVVGWVTWSVDTLMGVEIALMKWTRF